MSNKCHAACQSFAKTIKKMVIGAVVGALTTLNSTHEFDEDQIVNTQDNGTYIQNLDTENQRQQEIAAVKRESPCSPSPVLKITPQGTITTMEVPPDCPGKYLEGKDTC